MPGLDVGFMTENPLVADTFAVQRRTETLVHGRVVIVPGTLFTNVVGVVTQQDKAVLMRREDGQTIPRRIFIAARFQFLAASPGVQPDEVTWNGTTYTVEESLPYSRYGSGHYQAILEYRGAAVPPVQ